jgi:hypothetical protein
MSNAVGRLISNEKTSPRPIECRVARSQADREAAFRLIYDSYLRAGLVRENPFGMRVSPYHLLPTTEMFVATVEETVVATMSIVMDGELGLPMESIFPEEIAQRRQAGTRLAEVSCLADRRAEPQRFMSLMVLLSRLLAQFANYVQVEELLLAVHPSHARFYQRRLNFTPIAFEEAYPLVCNKPAQGMSLNIASVFKNEPAEYEIYVKERLPPQAFSRVPLTAAEKLLFGRISGYCQHHQAEQDQTACHEAAYV